MAVFIDEATKVVVQGLTGREGKFHALRNREYGTKVVAGTRPGKGGEEATLLPPVQRRTGGSLGDSRK